MKKRYNYFDDDFDEQGNVKVQKSTLAQLSEKIDFKKILSALKYVISVIGVNLLLLGKKIASLSKKGNRDKNPVLTGVVGLVLVVVIMIVIIVTCVMTSAGKSNSKQNKYNKFASSVCYEYIERYGTANYKFMNSEYEVKGCMLTGLCVARQIDFDNDGKSELMLIYNDNDFYFAEIWGFSADERTQLYNKKLPMGSSREEDIFFSLYSDGEEYFIAEHNEDDISKVALLRLAGKEFKKKTTATYDPESATYALHKKDVTDSFERIRVAVLRETAASNTVERTLSEIDRFSTNAEGGAKPVNASGVSQQNAMNAAYLSLVDEYNKNYGVCELKTDTKMPYLSGLACVNSVDFNADGINELMLVYRRNVSQRKEDRNGNYIAVEVSKYFCDIYTYNGKNAVLVYQSEGISNMLDNTDVSYYLIKSDGDENKLCTNSFSVSERGKVINASSKIFAFDGEKFETEQKATYEKEYGYTRYYFNGESCSKTRFTEKGGFDVVFFDVTETYDGAVWMIGYVQAEARDESKLRAQMTRTEEAIETLYASNDAVESTDDNAE